MRFLFTLSLLISFLTGFTQTQQQIRNLTAFSKLYGYVQYFHPSDEASKIEWQSFGIYGSQKMLRVKDDKELIVTLNELFLPIAPTVKISSKESLKFDVTDVTPPSLAGYSPIYWQHIGLKLPYFDNIYNSIRVNRFNPISKERIKHNAFALIAPININAYKGKKFLLSISVQSDIDDLVLKPYLDKLNFVKESVKLNNEKQYVFSGVFDTRLDSFTLAVQTNLSSPGALKISKITLKVLDKEAEVNIPTEEKVVALTELDNEIDTRIIRFFKQLGDEKLFNKELKIGEFISSNLVPGIKCIVPIVLYGNRKHTYPVVNKDDVEKIISSSYESWPKDKNGEFEIVGSNLSIRLADLIILYNALEHSYPYWNDAALNADQIWNEAIPRIFSDKTDQDFLKTLKWIAHSLNDGHTFVDLYGDSNKDAVLPLLFDLAEGKIVIKKILDAELKQSVKAGDELVKINGKSPFNILQSNDSLYSGSIQWRQAKGILGLTRGKKDETCHLDLKRGNQNLSVDIARTCPYTEYMPGSDRNSRPKSEWISKDIFYVNLNQTTTSAHLEEITKAKSVIVDMRGYLNEDTETFLSHLTNKKLVANSGMFTPRILYPNYKKISYATGSYQIEPAFPLVKAKIFLLSDATAQSATESFLSAYKQFKVATIVGQPTSGTNGNINLISMPGGYRFFYTGMLIKNPDGSKHHLKGVIPDKLVRNTILGIQQGRDEILEEAIRLAKEK
ncbi:C-terminal processing protease CtpA/Prc [Flavobacterium sp. W4I14]|nr:C-terminal processing protease CtpA/Prc [Flavobacterium sp. W4I14]